MAGVRILIVSSTADYNALESHARYKALSEGFIKLLLSKGFARHFLWPDNYIV